MLNLNVNTCTLGVDVGSTTVKIVLVKDNKIQYECYVRHQSKVRETTCELLKNVKDIVGDEPFKFAISGSAGYGMATDAKCPLFRRCLQRVKQCVLLRPIQVW